jgi:hypothetical protein
LAHRTTLTADVGADNAEHTRDEIDAGCCVVLYVFAARR